jgi:hypothetical protein
VKSTFHYLLWAAGGAAIFLVLILVVFHFQPASISAQVEARQKRQEIASQMRFHLASAADAEKSAVMATTDQESQTFADQARAETASVERLRTEFDAYSPTIKEIELLSEFQKRLFEFQRVDKELLDLAVKNTNLKAYALAFGPAAEAIKGVDDALSRLIAQNASSDFSNARQVMLLAAGAEVGALRIQALLPLHIAEESNTTMNELETRMGREDGQVRKDMKELETLLPANKDVELAKSRYSLFTEIKARILILSRENTNVRSLMISLNEKRTVTALCQDSLSAIEKTLEDESIPGENVVNPR